jgi:hypothetical protein
MILNDKEFILEKCNWVFQCIIFCILYFILLNIQYIISI